MTTMCFWRRAMTASAAAVLTASALTAFGASSPARAAGRPMQCRTTGSSSTPEVAQMLAFFGVAGKGGEIGFECVSASSSQQHNFCAAEPVANGLLYIGKATTEPC